MAILPEDDDIFPEGIYQIETTDPVVGGPPNEATMAGLANIQGLQLARRTRWLHTRLTALLAAVGAATTSVAGLVRLSSATNSTSEALAATPAAVKSANDNANTRVPQARTVGTAGLATGGGDLSANRTITVQDASQAEAEAGAATNRAMSPLRVAQAIANRLRQRNIATSGLATGGGQLDGDVTINVTSATQAEAEAGGINTRVMTPLRGNQQVLKRLEEVGLRTGVAPPASSGDALCGFYLWDSSWSDAPPLAGVAGGALIGARRNPSGGSGAQIALAAAGPFGNNAPRLAVRNTSGQAGDWGPWGEAWLGQAVAQGGSGDTLWLRLPSGLIFQWFRGETNPTNGDNGTVFSYPIAFPSRVVSLQGTDVGWLGRSVGVGAINLSSCRAWARSVTAGGAHVATTMWFQAVGY